MPFSGAKLSVRSLDPAKSRHRWGPDLTGASTLVATSLGNPMNFNAPWKWNYFLLSNTSDLWLVSSISSGTRQTPQRFFGSCAGLWHWLEIEGYRGRAFYEWWKSAQFATSSSGNTPSRTFSGGSITGHVGLPPAGTRLRVFTNLPSFHVVRMIRIVVICVVSHKLHSLKGYLQQRNAFHHDTIEPLMELGDKDMRGTDLSCAFAGLIGIFLNGVNLVLDPWVSEME
ncbi:hypothetical protein QR685DRAFT_575932 [Neurospora intermedia]|uniref:Uncharacterized protein n=1 Tax=Neurospora intermedia TaxID=5142 RepID=A0ABR3CZL1_NEUIN